MEVQTRGCLSLEPLQRLVEKEDVAESSPCRLTLDPKDAPNAEACLACDSLGADSKPVTTKPEFARRAPRPADRRFHATQGSGVEHQSSSYVNAGI